MSIRRDTHPDTAQRAAPFGQRNLRGCNPKPVLGGESRVGCLAHRQDLDDGIDPRRSADVLSAPDALPQAPL